MNRLELNGLAFAVIYVPQFSLQAVLRHEVELWKKPVALVDPNARTPLVCEMTEPARAAGVSPGLTPTQALARCGAVLIRPRSLRQENVATTALLQCAYGFSPHLEATGPGLCTLDLRGLKAVSGGDRAGREAWARKLQQTLAGLSLSVAIGMGATPIVARHAARWGPGIELVEDPQAFISGLPVQALEPSTEAALLLHRWGIGTVGGFLALGQEALTARLGLEALALFAAANCTTFRPLHHLYPTERFEDSFEFNPEIETVEPLLFLLRRFVDQFSQRLEPRGLVVETLRLQLGLESGQKLVARLRIPQPTRQADILFRVLRTYLENLRAESAVQSVHLTALPTRDEQKQLGLFETTLSDPHQFQETLARLSAILGADRVGTPALENSHRPDAFQLLPPDFENAPIPAENRRSALTHLTPLRRFRPALRAEVECEDSAAHSTASASGSKSPVGEPAVSVPSSIAATVRPSRRPVSIRCAIAKGKLRLLVGPWRASGHWWEPRTWAREEWDAATSDGQVIRLVHEGNAWFVEGVVD